MWLATWAKKPNAPHSVSVTTHLQVSPVRLSPVLYKRMKFPIKEFFTKYDQICNKTVDLVTFTEEILNGELHVLWCEANAYVLVKLVNKVKKNCNWTPSSSDVLIRECQVKENSDRKKETVLVMCWTQV